MTSARLCLALPLGLFIAPAQVASAQELGGARSIDIPIAQIFAGLILCSLAAFAIALLMKRRSGRPLPSFRAMLRVGATQSTRDSIMVLETRRVSPHADACRFTSGGREYLVVITANSCTVVSDRPQYTATDIPTPETQS